MAIRLKQHAPTGETRPWTLREILQGKPIDRPTHPMLVHFPIAFYIGALGLDVLSRIGRFPTAPLAATWLILGSFAGFAGAALTGLAERSTMRTNPGSAPLPPGTCCSSTRRSPCSSRTSRSAGRTDTTSTQASPGLPWI
jgi:hypothetical protein